MGFTPYVRLERQGYSAFGLTARARVIVLILARRAHVHATDAPELAALPKALLEAIAELLLVRNWFACSYLSHALMASADFSRMMTHRKVHRLRLSPCHCFIHSQPGYAFQRRLCIPGTDAFSQVPGDRKLSGSFP